MELISSIGILLGALGLILGIINSILLYRQTSIFNSQNNLLSQQIEHDKPIISVSKISGDPTGLPHPRNKREAAIRIAIKNLGYRSTFLNKIVVMINPTNKESFSTSINSISQILPLEIQPFKLEKIDIYFDLGSENLSKNLKENQPIKISIRFIFTHKEIKGNFLIGRKGLRIKKIK